MKSVALIAALLSPAIALAQNAGPQEMMDRMLRRMEIEEQQRFEDRQRQRALDQQEADYDRRACLGVGYRGPNLEQCMRGSAAWRRGERPGQVAPSPGINCTTVDLGGGILDTNCE